MTICGIQSYSLNCSQKEQGGSSSLHVRMYALVSCTLQQLWRPFVHGHIFYGLVPGSLMNPPNRQNCGPLIGTISTGVAFAPTVYCRNHVGTLNGAISSILGAGMAWRSVTLQDVRQIRRLPPRMGTEVGCQKFVYCVQTLEGRLDEAENRCKLRSPKEVPGLSLFWSAFWSFSLAIGARKSFSRLYLSRYPILGTVFEPV